MKIEYYLVLEALASGEPPRKISKILDMAPHDVESIINTLQAKGYVKRRGAHYVLTKAGRKTLEEWRDQVRRGLGDAVKLRRGDAVKLRRGDAVKLRRAGVAKPRRAGRKAEAREAVERWPSALIIVVGPGVVSLALWDWDLQVSVMTSQVGIMMSVDE